jgi:hypothetical protein
MAKRPSTKKKTVSGKKKAGKKKAAKAKGVKKTAVKRTSAAKKSGKRSAGKKPAPKTATLIPADSDNYPGYILTFEGSLIVDPPQIVRGTHTVDATFGNSQFSIAISHNDTDGIPNLTARVEPRQ